MAAIPAEVNRVTTKIDILLQNFIFIESRRTQSFSIFAPAKWRHPKSCVCEAVADGVYRSFFLSFFLRSNQIWISLDRNRIICNRKSLLLFLWSFSSFRFCFNDRAASPFGRSGVSLCVTTCTRVRYECVIYDYRSHHDVKSTVRRSCACVCDCGCGSTIFRMCETITNKNTRKADIFIIECILSRCLLFIFILDSVFSSFFFLCLPAARECRFAQLLMCVRALYAYLAIFALKHTRPKR